MNRGVSTGWRRGAQHDAIRWHGSNGSRGGRSGRACGDGESPRSTRRTSSKHRGCEASSRAGERVADVALDHMIVHSCVPRRPPLSTSSSRKHVRRHILSDRRARSSDRSACCRRASAKSRDCASPYWVAPDIAGRGIANPSARSRQRRCCCVTRCVWTKRQARSNRDSANPAIGHAHGRSPKGRVGHHRQMATAIAKMRVRLKRAVDARCSSSIELARAPTPEGPEPRAPTSCNRYSTVTSSRDFAVDRHRSRAMLAM